MENPFPYETYAINNSFFGRSQEKKKIYSFFQNSNNLVILSKRRMGKSSLIKELFRVHKEDFYCIYVDIFDITSKEEFATLLLSGLANVEKNDLKTTIKKLSLLLKNVRVEPTIDPNTFEYSIKPIVKTLSFEEMMEDFFNSIFELSKEKNVVLAIDEFQQISTVKDKKIDAYLRKFIQENKKISYIFLGSKRHMLTDLFEYKSPLFEMATPFEVMPINQKDVFIYVSKHIKISEEMVSYIYEISDGETKFFQHIFNILYFEYKDKNIDKEIIDKAIEEIINAKESGYRVIYDTFSQNQKKAFKLLTKYGKNLFSKDVLQEQNISKNAMNGALKQLFTKELIDKTDDLWFVADRAFELWGKRKLN
ncbi:MAG: ATP-binding protein [Campylobacterales bacterium]|nr:ATP-binding protein [Campylobacterales bacterium]